MATTHGRSFGELLRHQRRVAGLTMEELAERAGLSAKGIGALERGERRAPRRETLSLLVDALALGPEERQTFLAAAQHVRAAAATIPPRLTTAAPAIHTFLIADVRGYTRFTLEQGDAAAARLAAKFAAQARATVEEQGGEVTELRGDEALAIFASARQALRAAVELQARFAAATEQDTTLPLPVGIGLDAGEALPVEGGFRGAALNLAARLCSLAGPGEVLASEGVAHLARKVEGLAYHDRGMVYLKGFADPVHVLQVLAHGDSEGNDSPAVVAIQSPGAENAPEPAATPLPVGGFLGALPASPLVARQQELDHLLETISAVMAGAGRLMLLAGEPGVGKTRLAQEVTLALRERQFALGVGRCYVPEQAVAYYPFINALAMVYAAASADVRAQVPGRWPRLARLLPYQLSLPPSTPLPESDPASSQEAQQQRLFWEVTEFILTLAEYHPIAILVDDLHWADSASLALLKHLARHTHAARVLLLGTYRDVEVPRQHPLHAALQELEREHLVERTSVRRLSQEGTAALAAVALRTSAISPELAALLYERTDGNPFFTQEVVRGLVERGDIYRENGHWRRRSIAELDVPESVRAAIAERTSRLSERTQEVLNEASVLGQTFAFDDLLAMQGRPEQEVEAALEEARRSGLVREAERDSFAFRHVLIQQALYAELPIRRRRRLHRAVGEALERLAEPARERRVAELAFHYARSDNADKALTYLMAAAARTHTAAAYHEQATLLGQAIEVAERLEQRQLAAELHWQRGHAFRALDQVEEAEREFLAALDGLGPDPTEQRVQILIDLALVLQFIYKIPNVRRYASEALALADQLGRDDLAGLATAALAIADTSDGDVLAGQEKFQLAFARAGTGQAGPLIMATDQYGLNFYYIGQFAEAAEQIQHVLDIARDVHDTTLMPRALGNLLLARAAQGRFADALQLFEAAQQFAREYGSGRWIARAIAMWGGVHLEVGNFAGAETLAEEARELGRSVQFPPALASTGIDLLFNYVRRHEVGRTEPLLNAVAEAVAHAQGVHGWLWRLRLAQARAEIALARGAQEEALAYADDAIAKSRFNGRVKYQIAGLATRGQALAAMGRKHQGIADLQRACELARGLGDPAVLLRTLAALLELDGDDALLAEAQAAVQTIEVALPDEAMRRGFKVAEPVRLVERFAT